MNRAQLIAQHDRRITARGSGMAKPMHAWLQQYARLELAQVRKDLKRHGIGGLKNRVQKVTSAEHKRLMKALSVLLLKYGLVARSRGAQTVGAARDWKVGAELLPRIQKEISTKVVLITKEIRRGVRQYLNLMLTRALKETPTPTITQFGERLAHAWCAPLKGIEPTPFSYVRGERIARTEYAQAHAAGVSEVAEELEIEEMEWCSHPCDKGSGKRRHWEMHGKRISVAAMNGNDETKWFELPSGVRTPYPNWMGLPAGETINCRCFLIPRKRKVKRNVKKP